jgi:hypothetical protein
MSDSKSGRWTRRAVVVLAVLATAAGATVTARAASDGGALDGRTFVGSMGPQGKSAAGDETVTFAGGRFHSSACDAYGFGDAAYTTDKGSDGSVRFHAVTHSEKQGSIDWKGAVAGSRLTATFVWTNQAGQVSTYWVNADVKPAAAR